METFVDIPVTPKEIEPKLLEIWNTLSKKDTNRASLFNLIVYTSISERSEYIEQIIEKVHETFPCRTLLVTLDERVSSIETTVSIFTPLEEDPSIACEEIHFRFSEKELEKATFLLLPHFLPDLPIYVLWTEDPKKHPSLLQDLAKIATRVIFDSEAAEDFSHFVPTLLDLKESSSIDLGDLNWARTQGWRELLASTFQSQERLKMLEKVDQLTLSYNAVKNPFFSHLKIQSLYLVSWLSSTLEWGPLPKITLKEETFPDLHAGAIMSLEISSQEGTSFQAVREEKMPHQVKIHLASNTSCALPVSYLLDPFTVGQSLVREIYTRGMSAHFFASLSTLPTLLKNP